MHNKRTSRALAAAMGAALLLLGGCQGQPPSGGEVSASASPTPNVYTGQSLPAKVDRLNGTPLYGSSAELAAQAKLEGAPFLLIAPQDPTRALLVLEAGSTPAEVASRPSQQSDFSGVTESIDAPQLLSYVKDKIGLDLKTDDSGKVVVLKVAHSGAAPASPAPAASSPSPGPGASGASPAAADASGSPVAAPGTVRASGTPGGSQP
jgi:hypothetical protein